MKKLMILAAAAAALAGCDCQNCVKQNDLTVVSPDGHNAIKLFVGEDGLAYEVSRDGVVVVAKSPIELTVNGIGLSKGAKVKTTASSNWEVRETTPVYKKSALDFAGGTMLADFGDWGVRILAGNDGVAYRFETRKDGEITVNSEQAGLTIPEAAAKCWANYTGGFGQEESVTVSCTAKDLKTSAGEKSKNWMGRRMIYLPLVYQVGGKTVAVTESDVRDYPIWNFTRESDAADVTLDALFSAWPKKTARKADWDPTQPSVAEGGRKIIITECEDYLVKTAGTRTFPWRTFVLADAPAKLCEADIVRALAAPADPAADFSWVKPGKVAWDWWNCFDNAPKGSPNGGCTTKTYERFIDFAAKTGVEYVIFDEGWSEHLNIWKFHPEVDVPHLIDYANQKGVGIILWMAWAQVYGDEERVASHFAKLGAKGFKVDFMDRGDAECAQFLEKFAAACAKNRMLVDYHGAYRPTGLQRKYPNILNYEGVHGLEQMKWHEETYDFMANDVRVFFLRMTAGPMDYTPGAMHNYAKGTYKGHDLYHPGSYGTRCRQMAMMSMFEAPLQMLCDSPTHYEKAMESFSFMSKVPVVWDATIGLGGAPDTFAAVARKASDGSWYAAGMTNWDARDFAFATSFLGEGEWKAEIFRDAPDADKEATHYVHETKTVKGGETFDVHMAPGGGFVVRFSK